MNASMGVRTHALRFASRLRGVSGRVGALNAQWFFGSGSSPAVRPASAASAVSAVGVTTRASARSAGRKRVIGNLGVVAGGACVGHNGGDAAILPDTRPWVHLGIPHETFTLVAPRFPRTTWCRRAPQRVVHRDRRPERLGRAARRAPAGEDAEPR